MKMRVIVFAELDTASANRAISEGRLAEVTGSLLDMLNPEAAYVYARGGRRALARVVDAPRHRIATRPRRAALERVQR